MAFDVLLKRYDIRSLNIWKTRGGSPCYGHCKHRLDCGDSSLDVLLRQSSRQPHARLDGVDVDVVPIGIAHRVRYSSVDYWIGSPREIYT
jgi:hypothetical protein